MTPFHLAIAVKNLEETKNFYTNFFQATIGRETDKWVDFNFYGHQLSAHLKPEEANQAQKNTVDGKHVPVRHFGLILEWEDWHILADNLKKHGFDFIIEPYIRFEGQIGEQATMFFYDPSENALEFKSFKNKDQVFAR